MMIDFKGIHKTYPGEVPLHVLKGVDLHIDEGEYRLAGRLVKNLNEKTEALYRNELIGFIFQSFNLISFKQNIMSYFD